MRIAPIVLAILLMILALLVWIAFSPVPLNATGASHPNIESIKVGGDGLARLGTVGNAMYWLQALVLVLAMLLVAMSIKASRRTRQFWVVLGLTGLLYQVVWWNLWHRYLAFLHTGEVTYFLGFATPTAWMIYGIWLSGLGLLSIYVLGFRRYILTVEDELQFEALLNETEHLRTSTDGKH